MSEALINIIAYLISSANISPYEPVIYGSMHLLEGAERIIEYLESEGFADEELLKIREKIDETINKVLTDEKGFKKELNEVVKLMGNYLKKHYS